MTYLQATGCQTVICLPISLIARLYFRSSVCLSIRPFVCPSVCPSDRQSVSLSPSVCPSLCSSVCPSIYPPLYPSGCLFARLCVRLSISPVCLSDYLPVYISVWYSLLFPPPHISEHPGSSADPRETRSHMWTCRLKVKHIKCTLKE